MGVSLADYLEMQRRVSPKTAATPSPADAVDNESRLHEQIREYCKQQFPPWLHGGSSMAHRTRRELGEVDFQVKASRGRVFLIECKKKGEKPSEAQQIYHKCAEMLGHKVHVIYSFSEFLEIVK